MCASGRARARGRGPAAGPPHEDAAEAFVAAVDRGRYRCFVGDQAVTAMAARELGHRRVVVGDMVRLAGDISGAPGRARAHRQGAAADVGPPAVA